MNPAILAGIAILVAIVCIFLAFRFGKHFFRFLGVVLFIFVLIFIVGGVLILNDSITFKERIASENTLFLLANEDNVLAGVVMQPPRKETGISAVQKALENVTKLDLEPEVDEVPYIYPSKTRLDDFTNLLRNNDLNSLSSAYYKTFVFDTSIFEEVDQEIVDIGSAEVTIKDILEVLEADDPTLSLANKLGWTRTNLIDSFPERSGDDVRGPLLTVLLAKVMGEEVKDILSMLRYIKEGGITVHPDSMMFKALKSLPDSLVDRIMKRGE